MHSGNSERDVATEAFTLSIGIVLPSDVAQLLRQRKLPPEELFAARLTLTPQAIRKFGLDAAHVFKTNLIMIALDELEREPQRPVKPSQEVVE
jgi:hypothetical protein